MAEIVDTGYISLRTLIVKEWNRLVLLDNEGEEVYSTELDEDNWIHDRDTENVLVGSGQFGPVYDDILYESNQTLEYEITITGEDIGSLPVTIEKSMIQESFSTYENKKHRDCIIEEFDSFTFENEEDSITIKHKIRVPKVE